jgi:hypothetical protein
LSSKESSRASASPDAGSPALRVDRSKDLSTSQLEEP